MAERRYQSWGNYPKARHQITKMRWRQDHLPLGEYSNQAVLPFGNGRSYGDVCLNDGAVLIDTRPLDRFISFDSDSGVLCCEAGVLLSDILKLIVPRGWFLSVTPGTQFVTVGGAIANDVHGKNHHWAGTFGCHVNRLELLRSDGSRMQCSSEQNMDWFSATIGGLGLTGLITWAELQLKPISDSFLKQETIRYANLDEFFSLSVESERDYEYIVAWVDCQAVGKKLGRGLFIRANCCARSHNNSHKAPGQSFSVPFTPPFSLINRWTLKGLNSLYFNKQSKKRVATKIHYRPFFYPLDSIAHWNRIHGPGGFLQYQFVIPAPVEIAAVREILERSNKAGLSPFPSVLKVFGDKASPGLMSFPRPGVTLALDFPNQGKKTMVLLDQLDEVVTAAEGAVYPAKDARMSPENFRSYFPRWKELEAYRDSAFSSSFWRRVSGEQS
jgi:FAD/FMN-containing dehydrogenase